jgi:hypothetical protein
MVDAKAAASPGTNLGVIPDAWEGYLTQGRLVHHADPQIVFVDTSVTHNGHVSIRCDGPATSTNQWRESDAYKYIGGSGWGYSLFQVVPGDHVVFKIWMKTNPSTISNPTQGAIFGIDLYGSTRIWEVAWGYPATTDFTTMNYGAYKFLPYNTPTWTQGVIDFIVPSKTFRSNSEGGSIPTQTVTGMIPWICADPRYPSAQRGQVWFSDAELYINPDFTSTAPPPLPQNVSNYKTQYYLTVNSAYGSPAGAGWYDSGSTASFSVTSPAADGTGKQYVCTGYSGDASGSGTSGSIVMNGPKTVTFNWNNGQKWARTWYVYSGNNGSPWSRVLGSGPDESNLNFDNNWGSGTVAYSWSERIGFVSTRTVNLSAGSWTFTVGGDDGIRLYVDDKLVINGWKNQAYTTYTYKMSFSSTANHSLRLEWYEYTGNARVSFSLKQG